jgi:hypothetical protein
MTWLQKKRLLFEEDLWDAGIGACGSAFGSLPLHYTIAAGWLVWVMDYSLVSQVSFGLCTDIGINAGKYKS